MYFFLLLKCSGRKCSEKREEVRMFRRGRAELWIKFQECIVINPTSF